MRAGVPDQARGHLDQAIQVRPGVALRERGAHRADGRINRIRVDLDDLRLRARHNAPVHTFRLASCIIPWLQGCCKDHHLLPLRVLI